MLPWCKKLYKNAGVIAFFSFLVIKGKPTEDVKKPLQLRLRLQVTSSPN